MFDLKRSLNEYEMTIDWYGRDSVSEINSQFVHYKPGAISCGAHRNYYIEVIRMCRYSEPSLSAEFPSIRIRTGK